MIRLHNTDVEDPLRTVQMSAAYSDTLFTAFCVLIVWKYEYFDSARIFFCQPCPFWGFVVSCAEMFIFHFHLESPV